MASPDDEAPKKLDERLKVRRHRLDVILDLGFTLGAAQELVASPAPLYDIQKLRKKGCPHDLCVRILS